MNPIQSERYCHTCTYLWKGKGVFQLPDGGKYTGEFQDGLKHGYGEQTWPDGSPRYMGFYKDGLPNGIGTFYSRDGVKFVGKFCDGIRCGIGLCSEKDGSYRTVRDPCLDHDSRETYETYVMPLMDGIADVVHPNGARYSGGIMNGLLHGRGKVDNTISGLTYDGEFQCGIRRGFGIETCVDASYYEGDFHDDARHGYGKFIDSYDYEVEGIWRDDVYIGTDYDGDGNRPHQGSKTFRTCELDVCCICHDPIESNQPVTITGCMHIFHKDCSQKWLEEQGKCPMCQQRLNI